MPIKPRNITNSSTPKKSQFPYPSKSLQARTEQAVNDMMEYHDTVEQQEKFEQDLTEEEIAIVVELGYSCSVEETMRKIKERRQTGQDEETVDALDGTEDTVAMEVDKTLQTGSGSGSD